METRISQQNISNISTYREVNFISTNFRGQKRVSPSKLKWKVQEHQQHAVSVPFLGNPSLVPTLVFCLLIYLELSFQLSTHVVLIRITYVFSGKKYDEGLSLGKSKVDVWNRGPKLTLFKCCALNSKSNRTLPFRLLLYIKLSLV